MHLQGLIRRHPAVPTLATSAILALALAACEDNEGPAPLPERITIVSGADQYSKKGTELEAPIVVKVTLPDGKAAVGETVSFQVVEGGGAVSRATAGTNDHGHASVRWTLGPDTGPQRVRAAVASNTGLAVQIHATSSDYYCPEEDPAFARKFSPARDLFLLTDRSDLLDNAGVVQITPEFPGAFTGFSFRAFDEGPLLNIVRDCAFSANGDFYIAWTTGAAVHEVLKIDPDADSLATHFATLASSAGSEITLLPGGALAGCDEFGPFTVGCRDTLTRYEDAMYSGVDRDAANNDAVAADPASGDLYFIYRDNRRLMRLPLDGYTQTGPPVEVATLDIDEADFARGMVVDDNDGSIFILVDTADTRSIVKVTSAGVKTTAVDFFVERGAGDLAGIQSDLAIDQSIRFLYTLDTLNNVILVYDILQDTLGQALVSSGEPGAASNGSTGERVGLAVLP